jgi:hypothetical protein
MEGENPSRSNSLLRLYNKKKQHPKLFSLQLKMMNAWIKVLIKVIKTVSSHEILKKIPLGMSSVFYGMLKQWD